MKYVHINIEMYLHISIYMYVHALHAAYLNVCTQIVTPRIRNDDIGMILCNWVRGHLQ